jgi:hypothetical protein
MAEKISRRDFAKMGALLAAGAAAPALGAQQKEEPPSTEVLGDMAAVEKKLAKPLSAEARKMTLESLTNNRKAIQDRYKFDLPENSEPCTIFRPEGRRK